MNVNIFMKQFGKLTHSEVVEKIREGQNDAIGQEKLLGLMKILPATDEIEMIRNFDGDTTKLGNAEKFYKELITLSDFKLRLETMIVQTEFESIEVEIATNLTFYAKAIKETMGSESLETFLRLVLRLGNFMNTGKYAGNAQGFKISSLTKLMDTRANKGRVTLLHYTVEEIIKQDEHVLDFVQSLSPVLGTISRTTLDQQEGEINQIKNKVDAINKKISNADDEVKGQYMDYIDSVNVKIQKLQSTLAEVKADSVKMAEFFCEESRKFSLDEFFQNIKSFLDKVLQCKKDNEQRKIQEERAAKRKLQQEADLVRRKSTGGSSAPKNSLARVQEQEPPLIDSLLSEIKTGMALRTSKPGPKRATIH